MNYLLIPKYDHIVGETCLFFSKQELIDYLNRTRKFEYVKTNNKSIDEINAQLNDFEIYKGKANELILPKTLKLDLFDLLDEDLKEEIIDKVNNYLSDTYGFLVSCFGYNDTFELTDIDWERE